MDPNATLEYLRSLVRQVNELRDSDTVDVENFDEKAGELADSFAALDEWLSRGGFRPTTWEQPEPSRHFREGSPKANIARLSRQDLEHFALAVFEELGATEWGADITDAINTHVVNLLGLTVRDPNEVDSGSGQ